MWFGPIRLHDSEDARSAYYWAGVSASRKARGALSAYIETLAGERPKDPAMLMHVSQAFRFSEQSGKLEEQLALIGAVRLGKARVVSGGKGALADEELRDFVVWLEIRAASQSGPLVFLCALALIDARWQLVGVTLEETS